MPYSFRYENETSDRRVLVEDYPSRYVDGGTFERRTVEIKCCDGWLLCDRFTVTCDRCDADFNQSGARLAPRSQWGEETGEHWSECY